MPIMQVFGNDVVAPRDGAKFAPTDVERVGGVELTVPIIPKLQSFGDENDFIQTTYSVVDGRNGLPLGPAHAHNISHKDILEVVTNRIQYIIGSALEGIRPRPLDRGVNAKYNNARTYHEFFEATLGWLGQKKFILRFKPTKEITAWQMYMCNKALGPLLTGNPLEFIMEHGLGDHFEFLDAKTGEEATL